MNSKKDLSLLFYLGGHNDLAGNVDRLISTVQQSNLPAYYSLAVQWDSGRGSEAMGHRYCSRGGMIFSEKLGSLDSSSPVVLGDFIQWAMMSAPAKHCILFIFGHSDGFLGLLEDEEADREMTMPELRRALQSAYKGSRKKLDAIIFDCCWMSMVEVLCEIEDLCHYVLTSQDEVLGDGLPLDALLSALSYLPGGTSLERKLAMLFKAVYMSPCHSNDTAAFFFTPAFSLLTLAPFKELKKRLHRLARSIIDLSDKEAGVFRSCLENTQRSGNFGYQEEPYRSFVDIVDLCARILDEAALPVSLREAAVSAACAVEDMVKGHGRWGKETALSHGISLFFPLTGKVMKEHRSYLDLRWARKSPWPGAIRRICLP